MKIIVLNLDNLGDLVLTTPLISALKKTYPEATIDIFLSQQYRTLFLYNPSIHNIIAINRKEYQQHPTKYFTLIKKLRQNKYDIAINPHSNERISIVTIFSGAKKKFGFVPFKFFQFFYTKAKLLNKTNRKEIEKKIHRVNLNLSLLELMGIQLDRNYSMEVWVDQTTESEAERFWSEAGLAGSKVIGLNPGGISVPAKQWTNEGFAQLADSLQEKGFRVVFFGGSDEIDNVNKIKSLMKTDQIQFTGRLNILQLTALIKRCEVFVSADTGPMHVAVTQQVPVVGLFGPTSLQHYGPYTKNRIIVRSDLPCLGCENGKDEHTCMKSISAEAVFQAVMQQLNSSSRIC